MKKRFRKPEQQEQDLSNETELARDRRLIREGPSRFYPDYIASDSRARRQPRHFSDYISWFMAGYKAETPEDIHAAGLWVGRASKDETVPPEHLGGSLLGAPRLDDGFRRLLENSPKETDRDDDAFVRPMRAALAELRHSSPFLADALTKMANGCSIEDAAFGFTRDAPQLAAQMIIGLALERLYGKYRVDPEPRTIREKPPEAA